MTEARSATASGQVDRGVYPDIDPTFSGASASPCTATARLGEREPEDDEAWYRDGPVDVPDDLLRADTLNGESGPWVLVEAWLEHRDPERGRRVWGFVRGVLVAQRTPSLYEVRLRAGRTSGTISCSRLRPIT